MLPLLTELIKQFMPSALRAEQDAALARAAAPQVNAEWAAYCAARREAATLTAQIEARRYARTRTASRRAGPGSAIRS
ncbi:hypothetical protein [Streptomyces sp. NPDC057617]|uniref:hypothetical protein n=1 Tax=Streptomyces sp. NPDC057617 TaxID=3346184 RepID=UPI0036CA0694